MANKRRSRSNVYKWLGHIQVHFNDDERDNVLAYVAERSYDFEDVIARITQGATGVKFAYDEGNDAYQITLQPKGKDCYLRGYTLGFKHLELLRCLQIAEYIITVLVEHESIEIPEKADVMDW